MRVLVTGGAGFIGKHLTQWLIQRGHAVLVIDDLSRGRLEHVPAGVDFHRMNLAEATASSISALLRDFGASAIAHLAGVHFIPDCMARPEHTYAVNAQATHTIVEALEHHPLEQLVFASTMDVYHTHGATHDELDSPAPANVYGLSKLIGEASIAYAERVGRCRAAVVLRLANVYGPYETNPHLIPDAVRRILDHDGAPELVMGYLGATRDFVHVEDVADALGRAVTAAPAGFHRLNLGTGEPVPVRKVVQVLQRLLGDSRPLRENPAAFRRFDRVSLTPRVDRIRDILGWRARCSLEEGLAATLRAYGLPLSERSPV